MFLRSLLASMVMVTAFSVHASEDSSRSVQEAEYKISHLAHDISEMRSHIYQYYNANYNGRIQRIQEDAKIKGSFLIRLKHEDTFTKRFLGDFSLGSFQLAQVKAENFHNEWAKQIDRVFELTNSIDLWAELENARLSELIESKEILLEQNKAFQESLHAINQASAKKGIQRIIPFWRKGKVQNDGPTIVADSRSMDLTKDIEQLKQTQQSLLEKLNQRLLNRDMILEQRRHLRNQTTVTAPACGRIFLYAP